MQVVITGEGGQLAHACVQTWSDAQTFSATNLDITNQQSINNLSLNKDSVVINTAAYTNTEQAERDYEAAFSTNAHGPFLLAKNTASCGALLVHISTDYVFDGEQGDYQENDPINPVNLYGLSKYTGEQLVRLSTPRHYIIRTSCLFGPNDDGYGNNFVSKRVEQLQRDETITVVNDQWTVPTYTIDLATAIEDIIEMKLPFGTYHCVNEGGCVSWFDFTRKIAKFMPSQSQVTPIETADSRTDMNRPVRPTLRTGKLQKAGVTLPTWQDSLKLYLQQFK